MRKGFYCLVALWAILLLGSCGTRKNTKASRFYHAFNTRYNIYFNGKEAFDEALRSQRDSCEEDYSEMIHLYPVSARPKDRQEPGGPFDRVIEKSDKAIKLHSIKSKPPKKRGWRNDPGQRAWQEREEYNPFLKNSWLIMGKAQFHNADFLRASATFSYIVRHYAREKEVVAEARLWQARCYSRMGWFYEVEDILDKMDKNGVPASNQALYAAVNADFLIKNKRFDEAIPYLGTAIKAEPNRKQRARMKYLLGQLYADQGLDAQAYKTFGEVAGASPPYALEFAARIRQAEVFTGMNFQKVARRLERMGKDPKNKDYLDQVYYALGNVYLSRGDTLGAAGYYQQGIDKSVRSGLGKAVCQIKLGDIHFKRRDYVNAQPCFSGALAGIRKDYKEYGRVATLSAVLDELAMHVEAVRSQDSLGISDGIVVDGLYRIGMIYKDKLEDIPLSVGAFRELEHRFPGNKHVLESYYQIYLMALRSEDTALAAEYKARLIRSFPDSDYAVAIAAPDYAYTIRMMDRAQDSIYRITYERYLEGDTSAVRMNYRAVREKYPLASLMPKFMFLDALSYVQAGDTEGFKIALKALLDKYPDADVAELAGEMWRGVLRGRALIEGSMKGMAWNLRFGAEGDALLSAADSARVFNPERNTPYTMLLVYPSGSMDQNHLLFAVATYNFAHFMVKEFDLSFRQSGPVGMLEIKGFLNFDEAIRYYNRIYGKDGFAAAFSESVTVLPISGDNCETLTHGKTLDEYVAFFNETFGGELPGLSVRWHARMEAARDEAVDEEIETPGIEAEEQEVLPTKQATPATQPISEGQDLSLDAIREIRERQAKGPVDRKAKLKTQKKLRKEKERAYKERQRQTERRRKEKVKARRTAISQDTSS